MQSSLSLWAIVNPQTGDLLGVNRNGATIAAADFGGHTPYLFRELRTAQARWLDWCVAQRFLVRAVTLPKEPVSYYSGTVGPPPAVEFRLCTVAPGVRGGEAYFDERGRYIVSDKMSRHLGGTNADA